MGCEKMKTISELAREHDLSLRTLRFYEERGLIDPHRHGLSRLYSSHDEIKLRIILRAKRLGFTISEIAGIIARYERSEHPDESECLRMEPALIEQRIDSLYRQRQSVSDAIDELKDAFARMTSSTVQQEGGGDRSDRHA